MPEPRALKFCPDVPIPNGRLSLWAEPVRGMKYSLGLDFAYGIPGKDFDWGVLLDTDRRQVANLAGHWGMGFTPHVKDLIDYFGGPSEVFVVGEATATGMPVLRELYDSGYSWLYHHRQEQTPGRTTRDILGHVPGNPDITVRWLQEAIAGPTPPVVRDAEVHAQLCKFGFQPKRASMAHDEATRDAHLVMGAPDGEHDDGVRALALANAGLEWLPRFKPPPVELPENSMGRMLGMDRPKPKAKSYWS